MQGRVQGLLQPRGVLEVLPPRHPSAPEPPATEGLCPGIPSPEAWETPGQLGEGLAGFSQMRILGGVIKGPLGEAEKARTWVTTWDCS